MDKGENIKMINLAVINIKEVVKYLVKLTIVITVVVALTR